MTMHNPPHLGKFIREVYLEPFGISSLQVWAFHLPLCRGCSKGDSGISPEMSLRLSKVLGRTPESWLAIQDMYDLWVARGTVNLDGIHRLDFDVA